MDKGSVTLPGSNPYIGPRPFRKEDAPRFFGRESEARDLLSLVVSEQLVLFYAQSGAGKSSLVNARLIPDLEEKKFEVMPVGRVSGSARSGLEVDNIFIYNLLATLDQSRQQAERFQHMRLAEFLGNFSFNGTNYLYDDSPAQMAAPVPQIEEYEVWPRALIIDQFEEIVSTHAEAWEKRDDFFNQLAEAMKEDPYLWVVLVMREDFVAALDPYAHLLPGQMRARFYMRHMGYQAALDSVRNPVAGLRPYAPGVAEMLVDNLRLITSTRGDGSIENSYGEFVEPVQLQVVCYQLWKSLTAESPVISAGRQITQEDIQRVAKGENLTQFVSNALAEFYEKALAQVLLETKLGILERDLREWFSHKLITESETRGLLFRSKDSTAGLPNQAVDILAMQYIVRAETRAGGTWVELVHDRFVGPILQANRHWALSNQSQLERDARAWEDSGKQVSHLYDGKQLEVIQSAVQTHPENYSDLQRAFVEASSKMAKSKRDGLTWIGLSLGFILLLVFAGLTVWALNSATTARAQSVAASTEKSAAEDARATAEDARAAMELKSTAIIEQANSQATIVVRYQARLAENGLLVQELQAGSKATYGPTATLGHNETVVVAPTATPTPFYREFSIGKSVKGRDIMVSQIGSGPRHIVVVGGMHAGFAPASVDLARAISQNFIANPELVPAAITLDVILNANPDSQINGNHAGQPVGRLNANGVDLNRNWDCYWSASANFRNKSIGAGTAAFSEPETRVLRDFMLKNLTVVALVYGAISNGQVEPGGCGEVSVFSEPLANLYASASGYFSVPFTAYSISGDATNWLDSQGIASSYVLLRSYDTLSADDLQANLRAIREVMKKYGR